MTFTRTIPSTPASARELMTEALENALRHGNGCDAQKRITVTVRACKRTAVITVKDEGAGFCAEDVADPRAA